MGQHSGVKLLLSQQNPAAIARNLKYFDYAIAARNVQIDEYRQTLKNLDSVSREIDGKQRQLQRRHQTLSQQQTQLNTQQASRKTTLAKLDSLIADQGVRLKALEKDRQRLQKLLSQVRHLTDAELLTNASGNFPSFKGRLPWPADGQVVHNFGGRRVSNKMAWEGIVIDSPEGSSVKAVHRGRVVFSDYLRGYGLLLIVDHGEGYLSLYAHNQVLLKDTGEWVEGGEQIAKVGNSGGQRRTALYFELRHNGQPTNPRAWLKSA